MPAAKPYGPDPAPTHQAGRHTTTLTVDLDAIAANYRLLAAKAPTAATAAVVKADAYGLGAVPVSRTLAAAGCQTFFIALPGEGVRVRQALPAARIAVLNGPTPDDTAAILDHGLVPVLNSLDQAKHFATMAPSGAEAMLHVDTGMARLGLAPDEVDALVADPGLLGGLRITALLSHLACADEAAAPMNRAQLARFSALRDRLAPSLGNVPASFANSSAVFLGPDFHGQLLRPGAALYGLAPFKKPPNPMAQVIEFTAKILQIRDVDSPQTVGYGATHTVTRGGRIATIAAGYADGYPRSLSNKGHAFIANTAVPIVGRVSMDLITLDVTEATSVQVGDDVELIGPHVTVDAVAATAGTIGYEILTSIGRRTPRTYRGGNG